MTDTSKPQIVKPLEWESGRSVNGCIHYRARTFVHIVVYDWRKACGFNRDYIEFGGDQFPTLEAAKAAAQADYEQRILAALNPDFLTRAETAEARLAEAVDGLDLVDAYLTKLQTPGSEPLNSVNASKAASDRSFFTAQVRNEAREQWAVTGNLLAKIKGETNDE